MKQTKKPSLKDLQLACFQLQDCYPGLTPERLQEALLAFDPNPAPAVKGPTAAERFEDEEFIDRDALQKKFHVSKVTALRWLKTGKIRGIQVGKRWRIPVSAITEKLGGAA